MFPGMAISTQEGAVCAVGEGLIVLTAQYPATYGDGIGDVIVPETIETHVHYEGATEFEPQCPNTGRCTNGCPECVA